MCHAEGDIETRFLSASFLVVPSASIALLLDTNGYIGLSRHNTYVIYALNI